MESWKEFDQNPVTHSAAHHLVAIAELRQDHGYARVSDVAQLLEITRGSVSVTLKGLKQRGLVVEDARRHLGLSAEGGRIAQGVMAKKQVLQRFFIQVLGVDESQADIDTCKIEHLVSGETALRASRFLRFAAIADDAAGALGAFARFEEGCSKVPGECPSCDDRCLEDDLIEVADYERKGRSDAAR